MINSINYPRSNLQGDTASAEGQIQVRLLPANYPVACHPQF